MSEVGSRQERQAKRDAIFREKIDRALFEAMTVGRSIKCNGGMTAGEPIHAGADGGCKNDGSTCICECHDPAEVSR